MSRPIAARVPLKHWSERLDERNFRTLFDRGDAIVWLVHGPWVGQGTYDALIRLVQMQLDSYVEEYQETGEIGVTYR